MTLRILLVLLLLATAAPAQQAAPVSDEDLAAADRLVNQGLAALDGGEREKAFGLFERSLTLNPDRLTPTKTRAAKRLKEMGMRHLEAAENREALRCLDPAVHLDLFDPEIPFYMAQAQFNLASARRDRGRIEAARRLCREAEKRDPGFGGTFYLWGLIALTIHDYPAAVVGFKGAIERGWKVRDSKAALAQALFFDGVELSRVDEIPPDRLIPLFREAADMLEALKDDPAYPEKMRENFRDLWLKSLVNLAEKHQRAEELVAAEKILLRLTELEPESYLHWFNLGLFYGESLKYDRALEAYRKALEVCQDPHWIEPYPMMGYIYSQRGENELAEKYLTAYVEAYPESWEGHVHYASHLVRTNRPEKAVAELERSVEIAPDRLHAIQRLSLALRRARRPVEADQWLALFLTLDAEKGEESEEGPRTSSGDSTGD